ncbi:MAG: terminase large subunit [Defluviitaleaceae bacterium]|nr:terminase large subunit [Defluviitaleaceae bacterium]
MYSNYIFEYHAKIKNGEIIVGKKIKAVYDIIIRGLKNSEYIFDAQKANDAIEFIQTFCRHSKGRDDLITLELWQKSMLSAVFGVVNEAGLRVFREVFIVIGRKNGKTLFASAIMAYVAFLDGEYGSEIYCLAPKLDQAAIVYNNFFQMLEKEPELAELSKKRRSDIYIHETNTIIKPLAFNFKKSDGFNPELVVNDELSSWSGAGGLRQYEVMASALGARKQPLILSISTAGYEDDSIYDELYLRSTRFLEGENQKNESKESWLLPFIYEIDDAKKWDDINELKKANPNLGISIFEDFFREEIIKAKKSLSKKSEVLTKYCNIKQNSTAAWLNRIDVEKTTKDGVTLEDFRGCYAVGGVDLSQSIDLTAACVVIEKEGKLYAFCQFFMPADRLERGQQIDKVPYEIFVKKDIVTLSGENYVNYKDVVEWFNYLRNEYDLYILETGYDRYSAHHFVDDMKEYGYKMDDVHQGDNLTPVIREFEGIIKDGDFYIPNNTLLQGHFLNVALKQNSETRRVRPVKIEQRARIDGFVAVIAALTVRQKHYNEIGTYLKNTG